MLSEFKRHLYKWAEVDRGRGGYTTTVGRTGGCLLTVILTKDPGVLDPALWRGSCSHVQSYPTVSRSPRPEIFRLDRP